MTSQIFEKLDEKPIFIEQESIFKRENSRWLRKNSQCRADSLTG